MSLYPDDRRAVDIAWALFDFDHGINSMRHVIFSRLITMISPCNMTLAWCTPILTMSWWHANNLIVVAMLHLKYLRGIRRICKLGRAARYLPSGYSCRRVPDEDVWRRCVFQRGNLPRKTHAQNIPIYINMQLYIDIINAANECKKMCPKKNLKDMSEKVTGDMPIKMLENMSKTCQNICQKEWVRSVARVDPT